MPPRQTQPSRFAFRRELSSILPAATFALKLVASGLAGAALTLLLWNDDLKTPVPYPLDPDQVAAPYFPGQGESVIYSRNRAARRVFEWDAAEADREVPSNFPLRVRTVKFTLPEYLTSSSSASNPLAGKRLRYLIGTEGSALGRDEELSSLLQHDTASQARYQHRILQSVRREEYRASTVLICTHPIRRSSTTKAR